ncbi:MAG: c-type cytochrome [Akkermansiaceae bacterium]
MRYFFLIYALIIVFVISTFGFRGDKFKKPPIRIFPDMDEQDFIKGQKPSDFFKDGMGSQQPVAGTVPMGHTTEETAESELRGYGNKETYLHTGRFNETNYGKGFPTELELDQPENVTALLTRGHEVFGFKCAVCHGASGNGEGTAKANGFVAAISNLRETKLVEGNIYDVVVNGRGNMGQMGSDLPLYDRWAVVAYVKMLQASAKADYTNPKIKEIFDAGSTK